MKSKKLPLVLALSLATVFIIACGDEQDKRISDADAICLKTIRAGGTCGNTSNGSGTTTQTQTSTVTVTQTTTT